ncbi:MAG: VWA domain-containing protein [Candidatus Omnitrophica bacterium]|nr:VWA domain-containing protein [Candidatus Omnitrophota bacterium]
MQFNAPLALVWVLSVPVLLWLWRLAATQRQIRIPSLIPFERLLKRPPHRRTHLVVNFLFWLQLAALLGITLTLMQPMLVRHGARTILIVLDTSASMAAKTQGTTALERAKRLVLGQLTRHALTDQCLVVTTAPVATLTLQPTSDVAALRRAVEELRPSDLGGTLATAARVGRSLLGHEPDETVVVTDEPAPSGLEKTRVRWMTVGESRPNAAIVGLDAQGPLCVPTDAHLLATVQNFSDRPAPVTLTAMQQGRRLTEERGTLEPGARQTFSLALPDDASGWIELALAASGDALEADNHAWVDVQRQVLMPLVIRSTRPAFRRTMASWLAACPTLHVMTEVPAGQGPFVTVTDREQDVPSSASAAMVFLPPQTPRPVLSHWVVSSDHPIGSYLAPVDVVAASLNLSPGLVTSGTVVVSGLVEGRKVPIVVAHEREGHRQVSMLFDPSRDNATPVLLTFFNSVKWLMGQGAAPVTGAPFLVAGFASGTVIVHRPDGVTQAVDTVDGTLRYDGTTAAGLYRVTQGSTERFVGVNFVDPLESNLLKRVSTWHQTEEPASTLPAPRRTTHPLTHWLVLVLLLLVVAEWWWYGAKGASPTRAPRAGARAPA